MSQAIGAAYSGSSEISPINPPEVDSTVLTARDLPRKGVSWEDADQYLPIDILLLTVKDCEFLNCLSILNPDFLRSHNKEIGFVFFGKMGDDDSQLKIAVIQCNVGSSVPNGSAIVVPKAVKILRPKAVFCVGYCGGLNPRKVKLGDVVISAKLITYAPTKVTEGGVIDRGTRVPLERRLANLIRAADYGWKAPLKDPAKLEVIVHKDGVFLSGPELVDNSERREELTKRYPEAIAIEMEGEGNFF